MSAVTLNDNNAKLDNLEKAIRAANERRRKLIEKNKLITYSTIADLYGLDGQELIDAVTEEHSLIEKLSASGMSFKQYLNILRVTHAKRLIETTNLNLTDICFECGFGSYSGFYRAFEKITGAPPNKYVVS